MSMSQQMCTSCMEHFSMGKTILVVEDDVDIGTLLVDALTQETSYHALLVNDGQQALYVMRQIKPCLLITDYRLPRMNGIELYDRVQSLPQMTGMPTIIMSAYMPEEEVMKRHLISLHKPFELDDLLNAVEHLLLNA